MLTVERYYHAEKNPIVISVVRRERIKVPAGEFDTFVLKPVIKSNGLFSVKSDAEVWVAKTTGFSGAARILQLVDRPRRFVFAFARDVGRHGRAVGAVGRKRRSTNSKNCVSG